MSEIKLIPEFLKTTRNSKNLSVEFVVEQLKKFDIKLSTKTLYGYENGVSMPDAYTLLALCSIYDIDDIMLELGYKSKKKSLKELIEENKKKKYATIAAYGGGVNTIEIEIEKRKKEYYVLIKNDDKGYKRVDMTKEEFIKINDILNIIRK